MAKAPKTALVDDDAPAAAKVDIKNMQWSLAVQATYEDKDGTRSDTFRFDGVEPDMTEAEIEAAIKAQFA
jgi:hypothetical protein